VVGSRDSWRCWFLVMAKTAAGRQRIPILADSAAAGSVSPSPPCNFLRQNPAAVHGEMFNDYGWGGYFILALPERRVFVDGRNDFYGPETPSVNSIV